MQNTHSYIEGTKSCLNMRHKSCVMTHDCPAIVKYNSPENTIFSAFHFNHEIRLSKNFIDCGKDYYIVSTVSVSSQNAFKNSTKINETLSCKTFTIAITSKGFSSRTRHTTIPDIHTNASSRMKKNDVSNRPTPTPSRRTAREGIKKSSYRHRKTSVWISIKHSKCTHGVSEIRKFSTPSVSFDMKLLLNLHV